MKKNLRLFVGLALLSALSLSMSALPPAYMKLGDIKGEVSLAGHEGTIEIQRWSLGATNPTSCSKGPFKFSVRGTPSAELTRLCQSRRPVGTVVVDIDGVKHSFENASFESCQSGNGSIPTDQFSLNFAKCTFHGGVRVASGDLTGDSAQPNARLVGLPGGPLDIRLGSLKVDAARSSAVVSLGKLGRVEVLPAPGTSLPELAIELTDGTTWRFYEVKLQDVLVSGYSVSASGGTQLTLNFTKIVGPASGYPLR